MRCENGTARTDVGLGSAYYCMKKYSPHHYCPSVSPFVLGNTPYKTRTWHASSRNRAFIRISLNKQRRARQVNLADRAVLTQNVPFLILNTSLRNRTPLIGKQRSFGSVPKQQQQHCLLDITGRQHPLFFSFLGLIFYRLLLHDGQCFNENKRRFTPDNLLCRK